MGGSRPKLPPQVIDAAVRVRTALLENKTMGELIDRADGALDSIDNLIREIGTNTEMQIGPQENLLPLRELRGLDRSLRTMRTTVHKLITDREVKKEIVRELKDEVSRVNYKDEEVQFNENFEEIHKEIKTLEEQIKLLDGEIREYDGKFRSQFERVKQTINKMLNEDTTLGERVRTLFCEQGITIVSIITALGLTISALVEGILLATKSVITPGP